MIWSVFCVYISCWGIGGYKFSTAVDEKDALFWWQIANIGAICIPVTYYQFIYTFLDLKKSYQKSVLVVSYVLGFVYLSFNFFLPEYFIGELRFAFNQFYMTTFGYKNSLYMFFYISFYWILLLYSFSLLVTSYLKSTGVIKNQLKYFIIASLIGWVGGHGSFLSVIKTEIYPYTNFFIAIYPLLFTYAILRYRLLDIRLIFKRTMAYSLSAGLLMGLFVILVISITNFLSQFTDIGYFKISVVAAIIIALLFNPLRLKIQEIVDRLFYKKTYDYYETIGKVTQALESMFDMDKIYSFMGEVIYSTIGLNHIYVLAPAGATETYETVYHLSNKDKTGKKKSESDPILEGDKHCIRISKYSDLIKFLEKFGKMVIRDELSNPERNSAGGFIEKIKQELKPFGSEVVVPVFVDQKLVLLLVLGGKLSGDIYSQEDINLLNTISKQTAIAIKNAGLYKDKVDSERLASIGMMSATFAHEVRNPLTSLKTFAQLIPERYNDEEFRNYFSKIVEGEIDKIDGLIRDLLDFSTEKKSTRSNNFNLVSLVDETVNYVKGKLDFEKKNIHIEKNYGNSVIEMSGDTTNLKQAFINIITNGCQAMNGEGTLKVHINPRGENVEVAITDTGDGIHPDDISKIFDPFVTTKEMGIGLGLAISKRIVEDHKGSINVQSRLSSGTTFTISLPVQN